MGLDEGMSFLPQGLVATRRPIVKYCLDCYHKKSEHTKSKKDKRYHCSQCECRCKKSSFD